MVERTSTGNAPWTLVEANDKNYARVKILQTLCERVEAELDGRAKDGSPAHPKKARKAAKIEKAAQTAESASVEKPKRKSKTKN